MPDPSERGMIREIASADDGARRSSSATFAPAAAAPIRTESPIPGWAIAASGAGLLAFLGAFGWLLAGMDIETATNVYNFAGALISLALLVVFWRDLHGMRGGLADGIVMFGALLIFALVWPLGLLAIWTAVAWGWKESR